MVLLQIQFEQEQRMKNQELVHHLTKIGQCQLRIDISRQILAQNMNFSISWLLLFLHQQAKTNETNESNILEISHFCHFFEHFQFKFSREEISTIFQYFDKSNKGKLKDYQFISSLLPKNKDSLKKIAVSRSKEDIEFTKSLKHAINRFFIEVLNSANILQMHKQNFKKMLQQCSLKQFQNIQKLKMIMQQNEKYPSTKELTLISQFISSCQQLKENNQNLQQFTCFHDQNQFTQKHIFQGDFQIQKNQLFQKYQNNEQKQNYALKSGNILPRSIKYQMKALKSLNQKIESNNLNRIGIKQCEKRQIPKLNIEKSNSIIKEVESDLEKIQQSTQRDRLKKAADIAQKLLKSECTTSRATFQQIEQSQTRSNSNIRYPTKRRNSQQMQQSLITLNPCSLSEVRQIGVL